MPRSGGKRYDVFISFRGEDTRTNFVSHLENTLTRENFEVFIDYKLEKGGEDLGKEIIDAIKDSLISVVIFSENFASSKWCLDELVEILRCRVDDKQIVIPVFYKIKPTEVRYQTGEFFKKAFSTYDADSKKDAGFRSKVSAWRKALSEAANISGWDTSSRSYRDDSQVIQNIVEDVWKKLSFICPSDRKDLVEIDTDFESLLKNFKRIGIWGMGGIGKTTMARIIFAKHFTAYDSVCFLEKVSEDRRKFGLPSSRNKLLTELLKHQIITTDGYDGSSFIQRRLSGRKAFIVLDDVDDVDHLEELREILHYLNEESRLIITTRDKQIVRGNVDKIYEVQKWGSEKSLELFSKGAFKQDNPKEGYDDLSKRALERAAGVPLALKVLGSYFYGRKPEFWECELAYFKEKEKSLRKIQQVLERSYNGLGEQEQEIFLDIAFFFKGQNKDFVIRILSACGFPATSSIEILEDKALVTISDSNRIQMHDLLQTMGLEIVRKGTDLTRRNSRLRDIEEVCDALKYNKGTDAIEGIALDLSQVDSPLPVKAFQRMIKLRYLRFHVPFDKIRPGNVYLPATLKQFSDKLVYLEWNGFPFKSLPPYFSARLLVEICLPYSSIEELWQQTQDLLNLVRIDLSECKQLMKLPDLSKASKLRWLYLSGCENLTHLQPSTFSASAGTLETLLLGRCRKLESLISEKHFTSLKQIDVYGCSSLKEFSMSSDSIERLDLSNTGIEILHSSIGRLSNIVVLNLENRRLENIPDELSWLTSLKELSISNCNSVTKQKLHVLFSGLHSLQILRLTDCSKLYELPTNIDSLSSLYELRLDGSSIKSLPTSIKNLFGLEILSLQNCKDLHSLRDLPQHIKEFYADNCTSLVTVSCLKAFSQQMSGKDKYISFKNDKKMTRSSLDCAIKDALFVLRSAALHNIRVKYFCSETHSYNYNNAEVCLPGSRVPRQFNYRTKGSCVIIDFSKLRLLVGLVLSVAISSSCGVKQQQNSKVNNGSKIQCQCYSVDDGEKLGYATTWHDKGSSTDLNPDHVYLWYDAFHFDDINGRYYKGKISFEFCVTADTGEHDSSFIIKECGIYPIFSSELSRFLQELRAGFRLFPLIKFETKNENQSHRFSFFSPR